MRFAILFLVACSSHATKPTHEEPAPYGSSAGNVAPTVTPPIDAARVVPKVDTACQSSADCVTTSETFADDPPNTYACCSGCSETAVSKQSFEAFQQWCKANQPPMCPPLGCLMAPMRAECEAGHCVAKDASHVTLPKAP
ncbi:MAG TPA: hypothetical protein VL326_01240 [Kofleriaceae bacterium]|jgi:hypothetical protein|nr:hypothetical protein [Kofleriaceae bacterium]